MVIASPFDEPTPHKYVRWAPYPVHVCMHALLLPVAPDRSSLSEPAKSTQWNLDTWTDLMLVSDTTSQ